MGGITTLLQPYNNKRKRQPKKNKQVKKKNKETTKKKKGLQWSNLSTARKKGNK